MMNSYSRSNHKIRRLWTESINQKNKIDKLDDLISFNIKEDNFFKGKLYISILDNVQMDELLQYPLDAEEENIEYYYYEKKFQLNFNQGMEKYLPYIKIIPILTGTKEKLTSLGEINTFAQINSLHFLVNNYFYYNISEDENNNTAINGIFRAEFYIFSEGVSGMIVNLGLELINQSEYYEV